MHRLEVLLFRTPRLRHTFGAVRIQVLFGGPRGHSVDLMALPSNAQGDLSGARLPFIAPYPTPEARSINILAQNLKAKAILVASLTDLVILCRTIGCKRHHRRRPGALQRRIFCGLATPLGPLGVQDLSLLNVLDLGPLPPRPPPILLSFELDLHSIDARLAELRLAASAAPYEKQKSALQQELETFLAALPLPKNLPSSSPDHICKFLVWKDRLGKTQVHATGCPHLGRKGITLCGCPTRLAYGTVDSYIGKLRAIFRNTGQDEPWDGRLQSGNPASAQVVRDYLEAVTSEQLQARVTPKQAHPLFMQKLLLLSRFLSKQMTNTTVTPTDLFILARDQAYFKALFFSGDRGADLGLVKTPEILRFPDDTGFLFHHIWGKTLRDGSSNVFGLKRHPNQILCPIAAMETYVAIASELGINLSHGYLFRPTDPHGRIVDKPLTHPTAESRLKIYLTQAGIDEGETLHSFRSGCANTLALSGVRLADVMGHIGWRSDKTALYYLKLSEVLR
ncbi:hypothetical protein QZH41_015130, partial [Actinostola sp. cb2023]